MASKQKTQTKNPAKKRIERAQEHSKNVFLAGLGLYGKAYEDAQTAYADAQTKLKTRRKKTENLFEGLVKRGEKVEREARDKIADINLPEVKLPENEFLQRRLDKARESFNLLKGAVSSSKKTAA